LPTEAEWEDAARKNTRDTFTWGDEIDTRYLNYGPSQTGQANKSVFKPAGYYNGEIKAGIKTEDNTSIKLNANVYQ
jgi:formylglycine-generating enzyme required for sulfatase activity